MTIRSKRSQPSPICFVKVEYLHQSARGGWLTDRYDFGIFFSVGQYIRLPGQVYGWLIVTRQRHLSCCELSSDLFSQSSHYAPTLRLLGSLYGSRVPDYSASALSVNFLFIFCILTAVIYSSNIPSRNKAAWLRNVNFRYNIFKILEIIYLYKFAHL